MKKVYLVLLAFAAMLQAQQMGPRDYAALSKLTSIIEQHPEPLVSHDLKKLVAEKRVTLLNNDTLPEMSASLEQIRGKPQIILWFNVGYILTVPYANSASDKLALLRLVIYHEMIHIDDHIKGKHPLTSVFPPKDASAKDIAQKTWPMEWDAVSAEWALAKKWNVPHLVPVIYAATRKTDNPRSFLNGFYELQISGNAVKLYPELLKEYKLIYERESAKISPIYR